MRVLLGALLLAASVTAQAEDFLNYTTLTAAFTYTKATDNGASIGDLLIMPSINSFDGARRTVFLEPEYEGGYTLGLAYRFPHTHTHFFVRYDHVTDGEEQETTDIRNLGVTPGLFSGLTVGPTQQFARVEHGFEEFQFGFTHGLPLHPRFTTTLGAFFEYDKVTRSIWENISAAVSSGVLNQPVRSTENRIGGWGPGVGVRMRTMLMHPNVGFFIDAKTALLFVNNDFDQSYYSTRLLTGNTPGVIVSDPESTKSILNKVDIALGLDYKGWLATDLGDLKLGLTLGLRYMNIFNAFKNGNAAFNPLQGNTNFAANTGYPNDWGRFGPFLQFCLGGPGA
jgi:hypothetical protein